MDTLVVFGTIIVKLIFDSESDHLKIEATKLWCICAIDYDSRERYRFRPDQIEAGLELLNSADELIGHNILNHDLPLFKKLYPNWRFDKKVTDTFILSSLFKPDRPGGHSIDNFGLILGKKKPVHEDWSQFSEDMLHRCSEDAEINLLVYELLQKERGDWDWDQSIKVENAIAEVHAQQELNGVCFDAKKAWDTLEKLQDEIEEVKEKLYNELPRRVVRPYKIPISKPFNKDGSKSKSARDWMEEKTDSIGGPFSRVTFENINLNSPEQIKHYLLSVGWQPTEWNYRKDGKRIVKGVDGKPIKTSPKLTEDSYDSVEGDVPKLVARYNVLNHRRGLIYNVRKDGVHTGWLNEIRSDGKITAEGIPQGTPTGRYRHKILVNVPKADESIIYGREMRELFIPCEGMLMCGSDAKALENRIEGHYTAFYDGGEYARELLTGDPHTKNMHAFSDACQMEITRHKSKNIKYAMTYGAQPPKVAETAGVPEKYGKILYDAFWKANPALEALRSDVEKRFKKRGYLVGIDGRKLSIRSSHALLNTLFQSTGSIVVKVATIFLWKNWVPKYGIDAKLLIHQHDEWQAGVNPAHLEKYIELSNKSFVQSGKYFKLNIPIEGETKVGKNWAETH